MTEAMMVAMISTTVAFVMTYFIIDCQALGKDPGNSFPLQVHTPG